MLYSDINIMSRHTVYPIIQDLMNKVTLQKRKDDAILQAVDLTWTLLIGTDWLMQLAALALVQYRYYIHTHYVYPCSFS